MSIETANEILGHEEFAATTTFNTPLKSSVAVAAASTVRMAAISTYVAVPAAKGEVQALPSRGSGSLPLPLGLLQDQVTGLGINNPKVPGSRPGRPTSDAKVSALFSLSAHNGGVRNNHVPLSGVT